MKVSLTVCAVATFVVSFAHSFLLVKDFEGVWSAPVINPFILAVTDQGPQAICRDTLPQECNNELTPAQEIITIENRTIAINFNQFIGVNTTEKAAELFPACAASGIFPVEIMTPMPQSKIVKFNSKEETVSFIDPRRPNEINCVFLTIERWGVQPKLKIQFLLSAKGTSEQVSQSGPSFLCKRRPDFCQIESIENISSTMAYVDYELPCTRGACLSTVSPRHGFKFHFIVSKRTSVGTLHG